MRYKDLITTKLENLLQSHKVLEMMLSQAAPREVIFRWFEETKEKIEDIQTLINTEGQD